MQINKRKQLVIGATALGALVATATTAHAEVNRRVEKIPFKTETREDPTLPRGERKVIQQGVEGEKEIVTTTIADVPGQAGTANGQVSFTTKASVTTSNEIKPRSIFAIIDNSGSVNGGNDSRIRSSFIPLLQTMGPNDQIQIATYGVNQATSYFSNGANDRERMVTKMMNRDEFAKFVEEVLSPKTGTTREAILKQNLVYDFKGVKQSGSSYEFEDIFDAARNKDYTPVVMQFTDSWEYEEEIDSSFAEWSKAHAKTFMSVIYGSGRAEIAMKKAGHPNIFLAQGEFTTDSDQTKKVLEQIKATTTEVVKKGANQTVNVSIGGQGVTVTKATLKGAVTKELPIQDGKVEFSEALPDGSYTLDYEAKGSGTLKSLVTVDGKEVGNKTVELKGTSGQKGETKTVENIIKQPVNEIIAIGTQEAAKTDRKVIKIPFKTVEEEDENLNEGVRKVVRPGVEGEKEIITTTIPASAPSVVKTASGTVDFDIKAGTSTSKETTRKPVDLLAIIDTSSSMVNNFGRALDSTLALVRSLNDNDQITFAHYGFNNTDTYNTGNRPANTNIIGGSKSTYRGAMTQPMTKKDAIAYLEKAKQFKVTPAGVHLDEFIADMKKQGVKFREDENKNYQDIYMEHHKADSTISVIQFTDGWMETEDIDKDFATWATKNAKTFMTVSYKNDSGTNGGPTDRSIRKMTEAGHKNIYDERKEAIDNAKIVQQFESTATEKVTVTKQDVNVDVALTIPNGAKLESAQLTTPNGPVQLTVNGNVASYSGKKIPDGHYTLTYKVSGNDGDVKVVVTQNGKELLSKTNTLTGGTANALRLTKNSTAKNNGDGTYTQTITVDYDPARDGKIIPPDPSIPMTNDPNQHQILITGAFGGKTVKFLKYSLKGPNGERFDPKTGDLKKDMDHPKGAYTLTYTFRLEDNPVAGDVTGLLMIGKAKAKIVDTFEAVPQQPATPAKTTTTENIIKQPVDEIVHIGIGGTVTESKKEPIPFATEIIEDEAMMEGEEKVTVEGMTGEKEILTTYKTKKGQKVGNPISTSEHVTKHMRTKIVHRGVKGSVTEKENVEIPYTTKIVEDDSLPLGEQKVVQAGVKGNKEITRTWVTQRKLKVGDPTTSEKVTKEPVEEIIHIGTREGVMDTEYEVIPYETRYVDDPLLEAGKEVVVVEGVNGQKAINKFYSVSKGKVVSEIDAQAHVLRHPTDKVIHRGTGVKPEAPKVEEPKVEEPKVEPKVETPKVEEPTVETPKVETPKVEEPKVETPKVEPKVEEPKVETPKVEEPKVEEPKPETPKVEKPKVETPKVEAPKVETPKVETPKVETPKVETPKVEPKVETPKVETPKVEKQAQSAKELPKTGDAGMLTSLFGMGSIALGGLSIRRKRRK